MVVLRPLYEGETVKRCSSCSHVGLCSPYPERSSFFPLRADDRRPGRFQPHCFRCSRRRASAYSSNPANRGKINAKQRVNYAKRMAQKTPEERAAWRANARERKARRLREDPEGERARRRANGARSRKRARERANMSPEALLERRENARIDRRDRAVRQGKKKLKLPERKAMSHCGTRYSIWPFRAWVWRVIRGEQLRLFGKITDPPQSGAVLAAANVLNVSGRRIYAWLREVEWVDEMTLDRACSAHGGIMPWEIYATHDVLMMGLAHGGSVLAAAALVATVNADCAAVPRVRTDCRNPDCDRTAGYAVHAEKQTQGRRRISVEISVVEVPDGRFCREHAELLAQKRIELEGDGLVMAQNGGAQRRECGERKVAKAQPTCCASGCWEPRVPGERFCGGEICPTTGWTEDHES